MPKTELEVYHEAVEEILEYIWSLSPYEYGGPARDPKFVSIKFLQEWIERIRKLDPRPKENTNAPV